MTVHIPQLLLHPKTILLKLIKQPLVPPVLRLQRDMVLKIENTMVMEMRSMLSTEHGYGVKVVFSVFLWHGLLVKKESTSGALVAD
ncbi:hypothetical protein DY000_02042626 [Brassica cretica]|uniref:Uncharacterized protein n=1 Tax=Brassica cretica TaxID=69181 RepID=A0ABQ7BDV5_BRACR|nr:hypothetical protein DY000_02042626 [Brassica cretica]